MTNPADVSVLVCANLAGIGKTVRMALRGMGVRHVFLAANAEQIKEGFATVEPHVVVLSVDGPDASDHGLQMLRHMRWAIESPNTRIPIVAVSPRRDLATINAVVNGGAHEYVLFPASGDVLLKKIVAARTTTRPWIEKPDYFGPERRIDREPAVAVEPQQQQQRPAVIDATAKPA